MPTVTPDSDDPGSVGGFGQIASGLRHLRLPYTGSNTIDSLDVWFPDQPVGGGIGIAMAAWEPATSSDESAVIITAASTTVGAGVTFMGSTNGINGYLHVWMTG